MVSLNFLTLISAWLLYSFKAEADYDLYDSWSLTTKTGGRIIEGLKFEKRRLYSPLPDNLLGMGKIGGL